MFTVGPKLVEMLVHQEHEEEFKSGPELKYFYKPISSSSCHLEGKAEDSEVWGFFQQVPSTISGIVWSTN